ncbi:MAG: hypothetical protein PHY93_21135 [Bacteriovorax sp.]|nr:hypothetical protein [Bacteriovorax sp.]
MKILLAGFLVLGCFSAYADITVNCTVKDRIKTISRFTKKLTGESQSCGRDSATDWKAQSFVISSKAMEDLSISVGTQTDPCMNEGPGIVVKVGGEGLKLENINDLNDSYRTSAIFQSDDITNMKGATLFSFRGFDNRILSLSCEIK